MKEYYEFTWPGKRQAKIEAGKPASGALRPCPELSKNFEATENLYIEGDNLEVLKLLRNSYMHKVKMIYIDPPYNTGHDFIYKDSFAQDGEEAADDFGLFSDEGEMYFSHEHYRENTKSNPRYHSDWCSMIYPRLKIAKDLLREDGVIFISIDDNEQANLRKICDELFGENNFVAQFIWERAYAPKNDAKYVSNSHDYILMYAKNIQAFTIGRLPRTEEANARYSNPDNDPRGVWKSGDLLVKTYNAAYDYPITTPSGRIVTPPAGRCWRMSREAFMRRVKDNRIWFGPDGNGVPRNKTFLSELKHEGISPMSILFYDEVGHSQEGAQETAKILEGMYFSGPKPVRLMKRLITIANAKEDDIILDFFSGSSTTAHAVMQLNHEDGGTRKFIMVQLPEECSPNSEARKAGYHTICDIGRERIRRAGENLAGDTGFRCLRLDTSNFRDVYVLPEELSVEMLDDMIENIKPDRTGEDLLFYAVSEFGLSLSLKYECREIGGFNVYVYGDGEIIACFEEGITKEVVVEMAKMKPLRIVFRDSCFADGAAKINAIQLVEGYAPDAIIRVL